MLCTVLYGGWVDIGTDARGPLNVVVYLSESIENLKKISLTQ
jgi:hypothetical protein